MTKKTRGLGKGIGAFFQDGPYEEEEAMKKVTATGKNQVVDLPLGDLRPNPYQPRKHFDEAALKELAHSIEEQGLLQPIIVRQSTIKGYEIIAGERRFRATKLLGREKIPAIVCEMTDTQMFEMAVLENLQREDLTPLEEAEAYASMMRELDMTQEDVAQRLGKSRSDVANYVRLLDLPEALKAYLEAGDLSTGQARTLLGVKDPERRLALAKRVVAEGLTVRQVEALVQAETSSKKPKKPQPVPEKSAQIRANEDALMDKFGTTVTITPKSRGQGGKIEIEYLHEADLTRILDMLAIRLEDDEGGL